MFFRTKGLRVIAILTTNTDIDFDIDLPIAKTLCIDHL